MIANRISVESRSFNGATAAPCSALFYRLLKAGAALAASLLVLVPVVKAQSLAGTPACLDGTPPASLPASLGCYPLDCVSLSTLDWGSGGVPTKGFGVPKFDPNVGTLMRVDLVYKARFVGSMCADNTGPSCGLAQLTATFISTAMADPANNPPVTGLPPALQLIGDSVLTPSGFSLGAADGFDDCATPGTTMGGMSVGDCTPSEDHVIVAYDEIFSQPITSLSGADLPAWIGSPGSLVTFDTTATGLAGGTFSPNVSINLSASARIWLEATYFYCPNIPPICVADNATTDEAVAIEIDVLFNDIDLDGEIDCTTLTITPGSGPLNGSAMVLPGCASASSCPDASCRILYTPNPGFCGADQFTYEVRDDEGALMQSCPVDVLVVPVNEPPVAVDDGKGTTEGAPVLIDLCANDFDPDAMTGCGDAFDCQTPGVANNPITIVNRPAAGNAAVIFHGGRWKMRFDPPVGSCGQFFITYEVHDTGTPPLVSNVATITVDVAAVNEVPVALADMASTAEGSPVLIDIGDNDSDPDDMSGCGDGLDLTNPGQNPFGLVSAPDCGGALSFVFSAGRWQARYAPPADFCGMCQFSYTVRDAGSPALTSGTALVTVDVTPVNEAPLAQNDQGSTPEGSSVLIDVCDNDSDPDDASGCGASLDCLSPAANPITIVSQPSAGNATTVFDGGRWQVRFNPAEDVCGSYLITYRVQDTGTPSLVSNVATITVDVTAVNEAPAAGGDGVTTAEGSPILIDIGDNDSDPDDMSGCGDGLDLTNPGQNPFSLVSAPGCGATVSFVFSVSAGRWQAHFVPPADFCGMCQFSYTVDDSGTPALTSKSAVVSVDVTPVNEAPLAQNDQGSTPEGSSVLIDVCDNDSDPDAFSGCGAALTCTDQLKNPITILAQPGCGSASTVFTAGRWQVRFDPLIGTCGMCQFSYSVKDQEGLSSNVATVSVDVTAVNEAPVATIDNDFSRNGESLMIDVCSNDTDPDDATGCGAPMVCDDAGNNPIQIVMQPACGTFVPQFFGGRWQVRYTPTGGFCGDCVGSYIVNDTAGLSSNAAPIVINVALSNGPPTAVDDHVTTPEETQIVISLLDNDTDFDLLPCTFPVDPASVTIITPPNPAHGRLSGGLSVGGTVTFVPTPEFCGEASFTYQVCDSDPKTPLCDTAVAWITVTPVNDCPVAVDDMASTYTDTLVDVPVCNNDFDIDDLGSCGDGLNCASTLVIQQPVCGGTATALGDGTIRFEPAPGFSGECIFTYQVGDHAKPACMSNTAQVVIQVVEQPCLTADRRAPGSLLLIPEFDNRADVVSVITVSNTGDQEIVVKFAYRSESDCSEFARDETLTANDTLSLIANFHNPQMERGFCYITALCPNSNSNEPVAYNHLIGQILVVDGLESFSYGINAVSFRGVGGAAGTNCPSMPLTELNGNGNHDLDGLEYEMAPDSLCVPRFFGQNEDYSSELIMISLTGGAHFETTLDFLVYNDNEEEFSTEYTFTCWDRVALAGISNLFSSEFLVESTSHDPNEVLGAEHIETGWMRIDGGIAQSTATSIQDPAFYAVLVEMVSPDRFVADLPFEFCTQDNGSFYPGGLDGL
ncbi:MAG TPA: tandem-95 repeat protein [Planctomycetes bacterium]|nr:tandem-95 repeat protein [Planctomycetota bacterium]